MEMVDILQPPAFTKTGITKTIVQAWEDEDWIGVFNLWIVQDTPVPAIVYQQRSPNSSWAPLKLDVSAGGHYSAGEEIYDGLREAKEELGKDYKKEEVFYFGKKLNVSPDVKGRMRQNVVEVCMVKDNSPIEEYVLQQSEVYAICVCPISELIKVNTEEKYSFEVSGLTSGGEKIKIKVDRDSFPYNYDNYHFKMALLAQRFLNGEKHLVY